MICGWKRICAPSSALATPCAEGVNLYAFSELSDRRSGHTCIRLIALVRRNHTVMPHSSRPSKNTRASLHIAFTSRWPGVIFPGLLLLNVASAILHPTSGGPGIALSSSAMLAYLYCSRPCCPSLRDPYDMYLAELYLGRKRFTRNGNAWVPPGPRWMHSNSDLVEFCEDSVSGPYRVLKAIQREIRANT